MRNFQGIIFVQIRTFSNLYQCTFKEYIVRQDEQLASFQSLEENSKFIISSSYSTQNLKVPLVIKTTFHTLISGNLFFFKVFFRFLQISSAISLIFAYETPSELKLCVSEKDIDKTTKDGKMMLFSVQVSDRKKPTFDTWNALYF